MTDQQNLRPTDEQMLARYQRAEQLEQGVFTKQIAFNTGPAPHWIGDSDCFWYIRESRNGQTFQRVNAQASTREPAFDHQALAQALSIASGETALADQLSLTDLDLTQAPTEIRFSFSGRRWIYNRERHHCQLAHSFPTDWPISPDGKKAVFIRDHNLWIHDIPTGDEHALTQDGSRFHAYAESVTVYGRQEMPLIDVVWSPDSKRLLTHSIDTRDVNIGPPLVQYVPADDHVRPTLLKPDRRVALPEDERIEQWQILAIEVDTGSAQYADYAACPVVYPPYAGFCTAYRGWWDADSHQAYFIEQARGGKAIRLLKFNTDTGLTQVLIEEAGDRPLTLVPVSHMKTLVIPLQDTNELIWFSERSGYAHLYLYELSTGELKNTITDGDWLVRNVVRFDAMRRELFIQTAGRVPERNPYYCDICRVHIDTGEVIDVLSTDHEYVVYDQRSRISALQSKTANGVSPSAQYIVATRSRVDEIPETVLIDRDGKTVLSLEVADVSALPQNWQWPEPVMLKAADGKMDIYGVVFRPSDFDPDKSYPVLDCSYGYSAPVGSFTNNHTGNWHYLSASAYAELGFIVVMINNRGNEGLRNTLFNTYQDPLLPLDPMLLVKCNKADGVAGIQQLARQRPYMDISRVGVADFGSIPHALAGLLIHPDFYKVGVSVNPLADTRLIAALGMERQSLPQFENFADRLRGKLLLIAGMLDDVMPVAMTFRVIEALQKANKTFDMLLLPNLGHNPSGYTTRRGWDYFVEHLLGETPPVDFELTTGMELFVAELSKKELG